MLGEGTLGYRFMLITYRVCLEKALWVTKSADDIQRVRGEGTMVFWFGVFLVMVTRMDVLMCFRADILLEIPRVHIS